MSRAVRPPRSHAPLALQAGPVSLRFEPATLWLRELRAGGKELLRAVYPAVRNSAWSTAEPSVTWIRRHRAADRFSLALKATYGGTRPWFVWNLGIEGDSDGSVRLEATGNARREFSTNRTGLCVLHPAELAGCSCTLEHSDGRRERARFPREISPHQPFFDLRAITHRLPGVGGVEVRMEGDTFETEDQRNWTDASFKTYSRPLALPAPYTLRAGEIVRQRVTLTFSPSRTPRPSPAVTTLRFGPQRSRLPAVGLRLTPAGDPPVLPPAVPALGHLRVDLDTASDAVISLWRQALESASRLSESTGLECCLHASPGDRALAPLARAIAEDAPQIPLRWIVLDRERGRTTARLFGRVRSLWLRHGVPGSLGSGVAGDFVDLNRHRDVPAGGAFVSYGVDAQVHAFDEASILETLSVHETTIRQARRIAGGLPVILSPATFGAPRRPGAGNEAGDDRRFSALAAVWTLGCLAAATASGARAVSLHGTDGPTGILPVRRGRRSATLDLLAAWHGFPARRAAALTADARRAAVGVALHGSEGVRVLLGNLRPRPQTLRFAGLPSSRPISALVCARSRHDVSLRRAAGDLIVSLPGHAVLRLDFPAP